MIFVVQLSLRAIDALFIEQEDEFSWMEVIGRCASERKPPKSVHTENVKQN